jgi:uncharacterized membrane protein SpoIIM required for sporulation
MFYRRITGDSVSIRRCVAYALNRYFRIIVPMLIVAAFIEAYVTPYIA